MGGPRVRRAAAPRSARRGPGWSGCRGGPARAARSPPAPLPDEITAPRVPELMERVARHAVVVDEAGPGAEQRIVVYGCATVGAQPALVWGGIPRGPDMSAGLVGPASSTPKAPAKPRVGPCTGYKAHPSDRSASDCSTQPVGSHGASHPIRVVQRCARHPALGRGPKRCPVAGARRPGAVGHY
ncbi:MAG: hypothetical protein JWO59_2930 [Chloroflexi bacterium]|nr:hypothetical protein [Chloroflexota bacterium]